MVPLVLPPPEDFSLVAITATERAGDPTHPAPRRVKGVPRSTVSHLVPRGSRLYQPPFNKPKD